MRQRKNIVIVVLLAIVVAATVTYVMRSREPSYQGKSLSQWISGLQYENLNPPEKLHDALCAMGDPSVTRLIAILESHDSPLKLRFIAYAKHHEKLYNRFIAPHHIIPENTRHAQAATALGEMGPMAQKAIPALLVASQDKDYIIACRATAALMKIRQESPDNLIALAADVSATSWNRTARTLKYLGTNAQAAVPLLIGELNHTKPWTRMMAAATLGGIASRPEISVPALTNCLTDSESLVRRSAIDALCKFKSEKQQIVPLLLARMQDPDLNVWLGAAFGLEELLTPDEKKTLLAPVLRRSLNSPVGIIAENASMFLRRMNAPPTTNAGVK